MQLRTFKAKFFHINPCHIIINYHSQPSNAKYKHNCKFMALIYWQAQLAANYIKFVTWLTNPIYPLTEVIEVTSPLMSILSQSGSDWPEMG